MKKPTYWERVALYLLENSNGITEREGVIDLNITSVRNYVYELEHFIGSKFYREKNRRDESQNYHNRYQVNDKAQAKKLIQFINGKRQQRGEEPISSQETNRLLANFIGEL